MHSRNLLIGVVATLWLAAVGLDAMLIFQLAKVTTGSVMKASLCGAVFFTFGLLVTFDKIAYRGRHSSARHHYAFQVMVIIATGYLAFASIRDSVLASWASEKVVASLAATADAGAVMPNDWALFTYLLTGAPMSLKLGFLGLLAFFYLIAWMADEMVTVGPNDDDDFDGRGIS